jgi:hypothetical protein
VHRNQELNLSDVSTLNLEVNVRRLERLLRNRSVVTGMNGLDIDEVLATGLSGSASVWQAINQLKQERKDPVRIRKVVSAKVSPSLPRQIRSAGRASRASHDLNAHHLSQELQAANDSGQKTTQDQERLAVIDGQIQAIDRAIAQLEGVRPPFS